MSKRSAMVISDHLCLWSFVSKVIYCCFILKVVFNSEVGFEKKDLTLNDGMSGNQKQRKEGCFYFYDLDLYCMALSMERERSII